MNSPIYILHKEGTPYVEQGMVVSVSNPMPKFPMPNTPMQPFGQTEMVVDVVANVNGQQMTFQKLSANKDIEDSLINKLTIATNRDAMNAEVAALKQRSIDHINSIEYHQSIILGCDKILETLNPEFGEKVRRDKEIADLQGQVAELSGMLRELSLSLQSEKQKKTKETE
ncbi:MAG: hypothetical protein UH850_00530 [Paludibacteraceae bacterium]|nr:hypothetical protein [Paludibacteraceae bacterium]